MSDERPDEPTAQFPIASPDDPRVIVTGAELAGDLVDEAPEVDPETLLPHWTDAPTGQVPIVVAREVESSDDPWAAIPAPAWREDETDWAAHEDQFDASFLATTERTDETRPWEFADEEPPAPAVELPRPEPEPVATVRSRARGTDNPLAGRAVRQTATASSVSKATLTGILLAAIVFIFLFAGPLPMSVLVTLAMGLAAAEGFNAFRTRGAHPATILGIVAVVTLDAAVYNKGLAAIGPVTVLLVVFGFLWYWSAERRIDVLDGLGATIFVFAWVGVLGSYGIVLLAPSTFPNRHGLAYLFGAIVVAICDDAGALFVGRALGRHRLTSLSPNKTIEGLIGGTVIALLGAVAILPRMSPWTTTHALELGVALAIAVPLGDLFASMVKRTLEMKDFGHWLPGHGGVLDRLDGLLFALPTTYYLLHVLKLG